MLTHKEIDAKKNSTTRILEAGIRYEYHLLPWGVTALSEIDFTAPPVASGVIASLSYARSDDPFWDGGPKDNFAARYTGVLNVETAGTYTLHLTSDDGSALYLDGALAIDNDGAHATRERTVTLDLTAGSHEIEVAYFENRGVQTLELDWQGPDTLGLRQPIDGAALTPDMPDQTPEAPDAPGGAPIAAGLTAAYFILPWSVSSLADVDFTVAPTAESVVASLDRVRSNDPFWDGGPADHFAARYSGSLHVETGGSYTVYLTSDDGSALYLDGVLVIDNDGAHATREKAVVLDLPPGTHAIEVAYFENGGVQTLELDWQGPDTGGVRRRIEGAALTPETPEREPETPSNPDGSPVSMGLSAEYFALPWNVASLSNIDFTAPPVASGVVVSLDHARSDDPFWDGGPNDNFAARYTGSLNVERAGTYTLHLTSDDGSALYINGGLVIDNDGAHATREKTVTLDLSAGSHSIEVAYFENGGVQTLQLDWQGPDTFGVRQTIDGAALTVEPLNEAASGYSADLLASVSEGVGLADPSLAVGLSGFSYWKSPPFLNLMKQANDFKIRNTEGQKIEYGDLFQQGYLDQNGYPIKMYEGNDVLPLWQQGYELSVSIHHENEYINQETSGTYIVKWLGAGKLELRDFDVAYEEVIYAADGVVAGGRMEGAWISDNKLKMVKITETDPEGNGNYIHNISIVRSEFQPLYEVGAIFDPRYTALIEDHHTLRFMDWMRTNGSDVKSLADVASMDSLTWARSVNAGPTPEIGEDGVLPLPAQVPFDVMVQLANEVGADPWFNIPLKADDAYVRELAAYVDANLDDGLVAKFELSNEVWNWAGGFEQVREASLLGSDGATSTSIRDAREYYGYRSAEIRHLLNDEMSRVDADMVLGTQTVWYDIAKMVETGVDRYFAERGISGQMNDVFDALGVTGYFSEVEQVEFDALRQFWYIQSENEYAAGQTASKYDVFVSRASDYLANGIDALTPEELALVVTQDDGSINPRLIDPLEGFLRDNFAENKRMADDWGLELIQYEADSHIAPKNYRSDPESEWFKALNKSPEMGQLTARMAEIFREEGGTLVNDFGQLGDTPYGLWGTRAHFADDNPISDAYDTYNQSAAARFGSINGGRDPSAFLNGVTRNGTDGTDVLIGTEQRDYLIGGDGADLLVGGNGVDGLHGGAGVDIALFKGEKDAFEFTTEGGMLLVSGPQGRDRLVDVEVLAFAGSGDFVRVSDLTGEPSEASLQELLDVFDAEHGTIADFF